MAPSTEDILPWRRRPSIYERVRANLRPDGTGLLPGAWELPDATMSPDTARLQAGSAELRDLSSREAKSAREEAETILAKLTAYSESPTPANRLALYEASCSTPDAPPAVLRRLPVRLEGEALHALALSLAIESPDPQPVKLGLALLARFDRRDSLPLFRRLGLHDAFTLYCAEGLARLSETPEQDLWQLAQHVYGCGRAIAIARLAGTDDPRIRDWVLRRGMGQVQCGPLARHTLGQMCVKAGKLHEALANDAIDNELLSAASLLLDAEMRGILHIESVHWASRLSLASAYLRHIRGRASTLHDLLAVVAIRDWIECFAGPPAHGISREELDQTRTMLDICGSIVGLSLWKELALRALESDDEERFELGARAAQFLQVDTWKWHWPRLLAEPRDPDRWYYAMRACTVERLKDLLELASREFGSVAAQTDLPADDGAPEPMSEHLECIYAITGGLSRFPGQGLWLLALAFAATRLVFRLRALHTLQAWGDRCPAPAREMLAQAAAREPDSFVAQMMRRTIAGMPETDP